MKYLNKFSLIIPVLVLFLFSLLSSCKKDFDELNHNPHGFTTASDGSLFNKIIQSLIMSGHEQFYINNEILYKQTQMAALTNEAWGNYTIGTNNMWNNYYLIMPNYRELQKRFDEKHESAELTNMKAMLKIVMAYKAFKISDMFGDIPLSMAGYGFEDLEYLYPKFDSQETVYKSLLEELKWCDENISDTAVSEEPFTTFKAFDPLFNGNMTKWQKLANSLRLRYAMRMSNKEPELAGEIIREIMDNNRPIFQGYDFITYKGESACIWPAEMGFSNGSLNWSFREHRALRMGTNVWSMLSTNDSTDGSGIFDPRAYIFFEGNNNNEWIPYPQLADASVPVSGGIPYGSQRDNAGGFAVKGGGCIYSPFEYFLIRDSDFMPIPIITGSEIHFILAEAYLRGIGFAQDQAAAEIEYMSGINSSVEWWMNVASHSKLPLSHLTFPEMVEIPSDISASTVLNIYGLWNATTEEEKLQFIYTQRSLDSFRQPWEVFSLARRTMLTKREGDPLNYFRLPYPNSEVEYNSVNWTEAINRQGGGDSPEYKIWWIQ